MVDWRSGRTSRLSIPLSSSSLSRQQRLWASPPTTEAPPNVQDVEDETEEGEAEEGNDGGLQEGGLEGRNADEDTSGGWAEELLGSVGLSGDTLLDNLRRSADKDLSSKTLRAIQNAQADTRSVVAKMQEELAIFGAYAASKAMADSKLLVSVGIVVASEFAQALARPLLPAAPSSSSSSSASSPPTTLTSHPPSPSSSPSSSSPFSQLTQKADAAFGLNLTATLTAALTTRSSSSTGAAPLSLAEKVELVQMGIYPYDWSGLASGSTSTFILPSFSSAGDPDALLQDMYNKGAAQDGRLLLPSLPFLPPSLLPSLAPFLPRLPKQLALPLSIPLKALAALPYLPSSALRAIDAAHRLNQDANIRQPSRRLLLSGLAAASTVAAPLLGKGTWEEQLQQQQQQRVQQRLLLGGVEEKRRRKGGEKQQQQQQQQWWWEGFNLGLTPEKSGLPSLLPPAASSSSSSSLTFPFFSLAGQDGKEDEQQQQQQQQQQDKNMRWLQLGVLGPRGGATTTALRRRRSSSSSSSRSSSSSSSTMVPPLRRWKGEEDENEDEDEEGREGWEEEGGLTVQVSRMGRASVVAAGGGGRDGGRGRRRRRRGTALQAAAATMAGTFWGEEEEGEGGREGGRGGSRAEIVWPGDGKEGRRRKRSAFDDEDVIEARVQEVGEDAGGREGGVGKELPALLLKATLRAVDVALLGLEFVTVEGIPRVGRRMEVAVRRVKEGMSGRRGKKGWDLMPVFEKPMGAEIMTTRRR